MKLYIFRTVRLSFIRSLFTVHSAMVYVIQVCRQAFKQDQDGTVFHPGPARKLYDINIAECTVIKLLMKDR